MSVNLSEEINILKSNENDTIVQIGNISGQLLSYQTFYEDIISYKDGFWHNGVYYDTITKMEGDNKQLIADIGTVTLVSILIIIFVGIITWIFAKKDVIFKIFFYTLS